MKKYIVLLLSLMLVASPAFAQEGNSNSGRKFDASKAFYYEVTVLGGGGGASNFSYASVTGQFEFGYNLFTVFKGGTPMHRVGVVVGAEVAQSTTKANTLFFSATAKKTEAAPTVGFNYHFLSGSLIDPYAGLYVVLHSGGYTRTGLRVGAQWNFADHLFALGNVQGEQHSASGYSAAGVGLQAGMGYRF